MRDHLFLISLIFYQMCAVLSQPEVNLMFFKNATTNYSLLKEIHEAVINFRPIFIKHDSDNNMSQNDEFYDNITKQAFDTKIYSGHKYKYRSMLLKYQTHAIRRGSERLRDIPYYMSVELHLRRDKLPPMHKYIEHFTKVAEEFFYEGYKEFLVSEIDKEFSILNIVHIFNGIVYDEELAFLNDMILKHQVNITKSEILTILKHYNDEFVESKRADLDYVCVKFDICRPTQRFTEYAGDMISELLKLSDTKLTVVLLNFAMHVKDELDFFYSIFGKSTVLKIGSILEDLIFKNLTKIRKMFVGFRSYLANRYKFVQSADKEINMRNKALRILVDIVDEAFNIKGDEILSMHFNVIIKNIVDWSKDQENNIEKVIKVFVKQAIGIMQNNLSDTAKDEIKALMDILMRKEDKSNQIYGYLLQHGSKFVKGEDNPLKLSLLT